MTTFRYDPYLWVHLAGLATVPFWLVLCLLGFGVGYPTVPAVELPLVLGLGVLPGLYMQLKRPFYIFGLLFLALKPEALGEDRRRLLTVFRSWRIRLTAPLVALALGWCVLQLYQVAPVVADITPFREWGRLGGVALATVGVLGASLFLQVPVSVLQVLTMPETTLQATLPYPEGNIHRDFSVFGLSVASILPVVTPPPRGLNRQVPRPKSTGLQPDLPLPKTIRADLKPSPEQTPTSGIQGA